MERLKVDLFIPHSSAALLFTFQYGEIKSSLVRRIDYVHQAFTFQYGEIKRCFCSAIIGAGGDLHSSMERLKGYNNQSYPQRRLYLHSSMERLKGLPDKPDNEAMRQFTFQYGEIKSHCRLFPAAKKYIFTFQYGEIKSSSVSLRRCALILFTFQYGEIKRHGGNR